VKQKEGDGARSQAEAEAAPRPKHLAKPNRRYAGPEWNN